MACVKLCFYLFLVRSVSLCVSYVQEAGVTKSLCLLYYIFRSSLLNMLEMSLSPHVFILQRICVMQFATIKASGVLPLPPLSCTLLSICFTINVSFCIKNLLIIRLILNLGETIFFFTFALFI